jgi:hypothetical protein
VVFLCLYFTYEQYWELNRALGVSETAIRVTWSRVRKKLNGNQEDTPLDFIERILQVQQAI